jgi:16S rRNA (cytosine967-C5)-methyltransferase
MVMTVTGAWVRALQREPSLWLRARRGWGGALARKLGNCRVFGGGPLADTLEYHGRSDLFRTREFHAGEFEVQDLSSQAVGLICAPRPGETWWDACAGEGGKTLHLSDLMENRGLIWASDRAAWRLARLKRRAARAGVFNYRVAAWDGGPRLPTKTKFDGVLVDAPCSGIGTWHRNPHARWTTTAEDVKELSDLQQRLLLHAAAAVKPGGKLVYAACSLADGETTEVVRGFEQRCSQFERLAVSNPLASGLPPSGPLFLWPQESGGNGMCVAVWVRTAG